MNRFIKIIFLQLLLLTASTTFGQKKTYGVITYDVPAGWTEKTTDGNTSYSKIDGGSWAQIAVYAQRASSGDIQTDFDKDWTELVATNKTISSPEKTAPQADGEWTVMSGSGIWQYNGANVATILTVYSNKNICVAVLCNSTAQPYLKDYQTLIGSLDINASSATTNQPESTNVSAPASNNGSVIGLWSYNLLETSGYANGMPQYTAGYFRREYKFNADGTYLFLFKTFSAYQKSILFGYETGKWSVNGNHLTIIPSQGKNEEWSKSAGGRNNEWGSLIKSYPSKLEQVTYQFEIKYYEGSKSYALILTYDKPTEREGATEKTFSYSRNDRKEPLVDFPPGTKISSGTKTAQQSNSGNAANKISSPIAGKIWEGSSLERSGSGNMQFNTGGFFTGQYYFNADGTYRFVNVNASSFTDTKSLNYETGTYTINGDQLTIKPSRGANEEWTKVGKTSNGNSDMGNRKINESWNKKVKSNSRKLETYTYTFSVGQNGNKTALILQRGGKTEREGDGKISYYNETAKETAVKIPVEIK